MKLLNDTNSIAIAKIASEASSCFRCVLSKSRSHVVIGEGNNESKLVLVGEAPGRKEDETGRPFVGNAGKILDNLLESVGISREEIYITNILKCRPPKNRRPRKQEIELCKSYLCKLLDVIKPVVLSSLGNSSLIFFLNWFGLNKAVIGDVHGQVFEVEAPWGKVKFIPLYHPAASIYRRQLLKELRKDLQRVACTLGSYDN